MALRCCIFILLSLFAAKAGAQCTPAKDAQMRTYADKVAAGENVQSCSECGMLAFFLCSATHTTTAVDKAHVQELINRTVANINIMGDPICCPELMAEARNPHWGANATSGALNKGGTTAAKGAGGGNTGPTKEELERQAMIEKIEGKIKSLERTYYSMQKADKAQQDLEQMSKMDGNFNSVEQIEAEFQKKFNQISKGVSNAVAADNDARQSTADLLYGNSDATTQATAQLVTVLGGLLDQAEAKKRQQEYEEKLKAQKQEQLYKLNAMKANQVYDVRKALLGTYPDGGVPLLKDELTNTQVFFFAYNTNPHLLDQKNLPITITNVFKLVRNSDGTWPFKSSLLKELMPTFGNDRTPTIVGYFTSIADAVNVQRSFQDLAGQAGFSVSNATFIPKVLPAAAPSGANKKDDFWDK